MQDRTARRRLLSWLPGLIALPALITAVVHYGSLARFGELARDARPEWLLPAFAAQLATYVFAALSWRLVLIEADQPRPFRTLLRLSVAKLYTDQTVPTGGVSGTILVVKALARRGVPDHVAMAALLVGMVSYYGADVIAAIVCLALLWLHHHADFAILALISLFVLVEVAIPSTVLWAKSQATHTGLPRWVARLPLAQNLIDAVAEAPDDLIRDPVLLAGTLACQCAIIASDTVTLWLICQALDAPIAPWMAFCGFTIGAIVAMIAPSPLGLGTFEAGTTGMLALLGMPLEAALSATILLRGFTFWLPMLPGIWIARRELRQLQGAAVLAATTSNQGSSSGRH
jgi:glycosyltransferase 2 family protein